MLTSFNYYLRRKPFMALLATAFMLSACDGTNPVDLPLAEQSPSAEPNFGLVVPRVLVETRNINVESLYPIVTLSDGREIAMNNTGNGFTGTIEVAANSQQEITVIWNETYDGQELPLARISRPVVVGNMAFAVSIGSSEYLTDLDSDQDGATNLDERKALTNPFDPSSGGGSGPLPNNMVNVIIPRIDPSNAPVIDGLGAAYDPTELVLVGEWANAAQQGVVAGTDLFIDSLMIDKGNINVENNPFHRWAASHDGTFLYLLVLVDDIGQHQSDNQVEMWNDDSIELFTDGNNSKSTTYSDSDDRYFTLPLQQYNSPRANNNSPNADSTGISRIQQGFQISAPIPPTMEFATGIGTGPLSLRSASERQDVYELKIRLSELGISVGSPFGIELQINDDDDGGARDSKWGWAHPARATQDTDNTYQNPSFMATAQLAN